ncbi:COG3014 family protein [Pseudomonas gingeri]|uniref:Lipoprotein n=1 Tax=Pseudomonas gingeri TaxID=117681 RepID=A0A7Y7YEK9_9PSED|nr:hypothetical protein [Pseudomonas gingeri]NWA04262.1 hypothetical protein [Pseudomonas gingeri]NWA15163.1 hypothetical protein [Pseudomonas gingeri]NWA54604.1 hypothetical protein [Pseudomonas gingeri]NWA98361.1 hypothetical protein [Pseudomonas gingeri]NWB04125.1 hypothetical protein [Pseudomonas gingeri]
MGLRLFTCLLLCCLLGSCAAYRNYNDELQMTNEQLAAGNVDEALYLLERHNPWDAKDLLYYLEKGELLRAKGDLLASQGAWRTADRAVFQREDSTDFDYIKLLAELGTMSINDKVRRYDGYDYEKVMLTTQMALNLLALHDFDGARVDIRKTHEREAQIAQLRDKEYLRLETEAREQGISLRYKDLQGYPVAILDAPEVLALKNGYQSAFSHYLAGFVYEALGERDLAAPGYRQAIELRPNTPFLEQALSNLGKPPESARGSDVLIIVQSGLAPARSSVRLPFAVQMQDGQAITSIVSFPILVPDTSTPKPGSISVDGRKQPLTLLNSITDMSLRTLRDDMPGIIQRTRWRATLNAQAQALDNKKHPEKAKYIVEAPFEQADTRTWRTLPDNTYVVRLRLKPGQHRLSLPLASASPPVSFTIDRPFQVISLRVIGNRTFPR